MLKNFMQKCGGGWRDWREKAHRLKREVYAVYLAYRDPRVPWYAKILGALVVGYAFSPIDLIPDFIPVLGYLDDLILVPIGIAWIIRLIPPDIFDEYRAKADEAFAAEKPRNWAVAAIIILIWAAVLLWLAKILLDWVYKH